MENGLAEGKSRERERDRTRTLIDSRAPVQSLVDKRYVHGS